MNLKDEEEQLLRLVASDLAYVKAECHPECSDEALIRVSVFLRKLLVEDLFGKAWRLLDLEPRAPRIIAPRMRAENLPVTSFQVAGGGTVGGLAIANFTYIEGEALNSEQFRARGYGGPEDVEFDFSLSEFKESCSIFIEGKKASRQQVVKYAANKLGGAHYDPKRGDDKKDSEAFRALDVARAKGITFGGQMNTGGEPSKGKDPVFLQLISIGQQISNSESASQLIDAIERVVQRR